jgi:hypothetical protein
MKRHRQLITCGRTTRTAVNVMGCASTYSDNCDNDRVSAALLSFRQRKNLNLNVNLKKSSTGMHFLTAASSGSVLDFI